MTNWTRRRFLEMGALAGAGLTVPRSWLRERAAAAGGTAPPWSMAMHIHSSFSEGNGSMEGHLSQAAENAVDVIWWTDHDWRMSAYGYREAVHFTSLTGEVENGSAWGWTPATSGKLASSGCGIVTDPVSPLDPAPAGALRIAATAASSAGRAGGGLRLTAFADNDNYRRSIYGQTLQIEVFPQSIGPQAYLELRIDGSARPANGTRPDGRTVLSYRIGGVGEPGSRVAKGYVGVVTLAAVPDQWTSLTLDLYGDAAAMWPDVDCRDISLVRLSLGAHSSGSGCAGAFDYLRFGRSQSGADALAMQRDMAARYSTSFPSVTTHVGTELSYLDPHVNWIGGAIALPDYSTAGSDGNAFDTGMIETVHAGGGLASYNHMYGVQPGPLLSTAQQEAKRRKVTSSLLRSDALGADILEVGYRVRGYVSIERHVAAWDTFSRNGLYLTGSGTSDDHNGTGWTSMTNRFLTYAWAPSRSEDDLVAALTAGRIFVGELGSFSGALDLLVDGQYPMGSVSTSAANSRSVLITASGLPAGSTLQVVTGPVDYAGPAVPDPGTAVVRTWAAAALSSGSVTYGCPTRSPAFLRLQVLDAAGTLIAFSNPVWLLRDAGKTAVPAARRHFG